MTPAAVITAAMLVGVSGARGADIVKANNTDRMIDGSSWVGGIAPGVNDTAIFNSTLQTSGFGTGAPLSWLGPRGLRPVQAPSTSVTTPRPTMSVFFRGRCGHVGRIP